MDAARCRAVSIALLSALLLSGGLALPGRAEPPPPKDWEVELLPYGWLPSLDGSVETRSGGTEHLSVGASDILQSLELGAMGRVNVRWRRWLLLVDGLWTDIGQEVDVRRNRLRIDADLDLQMGLAQALGGYRIFARPGGLLATPAPGDERVFGIDVLAGANFVHLSSDVELDRAAIGQIPANERDFGSSESWFAPAVGLRLHNDFTSRVRLETLGVAGGFGVGDAPSLSWQLTTLLSYRFSDHWMVSIGHRLIAADGDETAIRMHGAMLGVGYRF